MHIPMTFTPWWPSATSTSIVVSTSLLLPPEEQKRDYRGPKSILPASSLLPTSPGCRKPQDVGLEKSTSIWQPGAAPCTQTKEQAFGTKRKQQRSTPGCFCQSVAEGECPVFFFFFNIYIFNHITERKCRGLLQSLSLGALLLPSGCAAFAVMNI